MVNRWAALALLGVLWGLAHAGTPASLQFERLWPAQQQPYFFNFPTELLFDRDDQLMVVDRGFSRISRYSVGGRLISAVTVSQPDGARLLIADAAVADDGTIWLANGFFLSRLPPGQSESIAEAANGVLEFKRPESVAVGPTGDIFIRTQGEFAGVLPEVTADIPAELIRFDRSLNLITSWTIGPPQIASLKSRGLAIGPDSSVYITGANEVIKYDNQGNELLRWGSQGAGNGEFNFDSDADDGLFGAPLEINQNGQVFVGDALNDRLQVFDDTGNFIRQIGSQGFPSGNGLLSGPSLLGVSSAGDVFTYDDSLHRFLETAEFLNTFGTNSREPGRFTQLSSVTVAPGGDIVTVSGDSRVQRFTADGAFVREFTSNQGLLSDVGVLSDGSIVVSSASEAEPPLQLFDAVGNQLATFGPPTGPSPSFTDGLNTNIAVDAEDNIYLVAITRDEVLKFNSSGQQLLSFGSTGKGDGEFVGPKDVEVGADGTIYVVDALAGPGPNDGPRLQSFDPSGQHLITFEDSGAINLDGIAEGADGFIYVTFGTDGEIGVYDPSNGAYLGVVADNGSAPGQFANPNSLAFNAAGELYVADFSLSRVTRFSPNPAAAQTARAIVVAAGGPYPGNALWDATQGNASFAVRALANQGFTKDTIQYLSADLELDLDQNGEADDVDGDATVANLQNAILGGFADGTDELVLYLVDHGGENTFRMSGTETLDSATLAGWLDSWQTRNPGARVTMIYDACQSGSFLDELAGPSRVVITSAQAEENAYFVSSGTLSFSNHFWSQVFNGRSLEQAYSFARNSQSMSFPLQNPLLDANGNGIGNENEDLNLLNTRFIGTGSENAGDVPTIGQVTAPQTIPSGNSATIRADDVVDQVGDPANPETVPASRVWVVVRPPGFNPGSPDNPISALPTFDLAPIGDNNFEATFDGFSDPGTYDLTVYALDSDGNTAQPKTTMVTVDNPLSRKAVVIVGGETGEEGHAISIANADRAFLALVEQGYGEAQCGIANPVCDNTCDNICFLKTESTVTQGFDSNTTAANIREAIEGWGTDEAQDLTIYLAAAEEAGGAYRLGQTETLTAAALKGHLDVAQQTLGGTVTVVIEGSNSGGFISQLTPPGDEARILIASADAGEESLALVDGQVSFSRFFWNQALNGATVRNAFNLARAAMQFNTTAQSPQLDDNGNGISNELLDGQVARFYAIGKGILLAGDDPLLGSITVNGDLVSDFESISVAEVTTTGTIARVASVVTRPDGSRITEPLTLTPGGYAARSYGLCSEAGSYEVAVYAIDDEGAASVPATATANRTTDCIDFQFQSGFE
ncbi:MAG: C13 family peptidase [Pseudomonadota bacterium]